MPIYQTARYRVRPGAVDQVKAAIAEYAGYVADSEPGTSAYAVWQEEGDPTRFVHIQVFADELARQAHRSSAAIRQLEAAYGHELVGPVEFTGYRLVAGESG